MQKVKPQQSESAILELDEIVIRYIEQTLAVTGGNIHGKGGAAELLGINPGTLRSRIKKPGIKQRKTTMSGNNRNFRQ